MRTNTTLVVARNEGSSSSQSDIINFLDDNNEWYTAKELQNLLGFNRRPAINRCLRQLWKYGFVERKESVDTVSGKEYVYRSGKWQE